MTLPMTRLSHFVIRVFVWDLCIHVGVLSWISVFISIYKPPRYAIFEFLKMLEKLENVFLCFLDELANQ